MIVSGGENVFPKEVEDCLARHENVAGRGSDRCRRRGLRQATARLRGEGDGDVDEDTLKAHVKDNLARYKVPREIIFLDELPRNATGKVLKKDLRSTTRTATRRARRLTGLETSHGRGLTVDGTP